MRYMYNKLFTKILDSSIWLAPDPQRIVWITLIAAMDRHGIAEFACAENLALRARVDLEATKKAIEAFESPDPYGPNQENEGRRIERIDGGWLILNAEKYRKLVSAAVAAAKTAERVKKHRESKRVTECNGLKRSVTPSEHIKSNHQNQSVKNNASSEKPQESAMERNQSSEALKRIRERIGT
jgi:hypothetical protein